MNSSRFITFALCASLCGQACGQTPELDKDLSELAEKVAVQVGDHARKKVAILDLADLQGASSELGRYMAEQLTVNLVVGKRTFSVLDRANLKSILAEHKLTAKGLVDPENAKKLGMFAGVDALVLGTLVPIGTNIQITLKIVTTDTAEIIGAAKGVTPKTPEIVKLLSNSIANVETSDPGVGTNSQRIGDLLVKVESLRYTFDAYSYVAATLVIQNLSSSATIMAALKSILLTNNRGDEFRSVETTGISLVGYAGDVQEIPPQNSIRVTVKFQSAFYGPKAANYPPYRLQAEMHTAEVSQGRYLNPKSPTLLIDIDKTK